ncbi:MAG: hypothetical protein NTV80_08615 [Verrucomicrobia bacterium]|nr:hypothetical protein [Verrucomicrobiota bacterium]
MKPAFLQLKPVHPLRIGVLVLGVVALLAVGGAWLSWHFEVSRLRSPQSVIEETGLRLPEHARITATRAHLFSLADRDNYEWLIQSDSSLLPWATTNMRAETGGWEQIRQMAELGFSEEIPPNAKFGGVWRATLRTSRGREETSYLYLADDGRVAILGTFRP